jgi:hypothetical protein
MTQSDRAAALGAAGLEKSQRLLAVADQQVLGLLIVVASALPASRLKPFTTLSTTGGNKS